MNSRKEKGVELLGRQQELVGSFYNPFTVPTAIFLNKFKCITPNRLSILVFICGLVAASLFISHKFILASVFLIALHFIDALDGKIAKLRHEASDAGEWVDCVTGYTAYVIVFIAMIFTFNNLFTALAGALILGFYSLSVMMSFSYNSTKKKGIKKKGKGMIKDKKWYMSIWGTTLIPVVLIATTIIGYPYLTWYFFGLGYVGYYCVLIFLQWRDLK